MKTEIKTDVEGLAIGMYVSRLDRPWLETSFTVQGIEIRNRDEIDELRKYCNYVYVDVDKGLAPAPGFRISTDLPEQGMQVRSCALELQSIDEAPENGNSSPKRTSYAITTDFDSELKKAAVIYTDLRDELERLVYRLQVGNGLDVMSVRRVITLMTASIIRNPAAMMWVISLRKINDNNYSRPLGNCVWCTTFGRHLGLPLEAIENLALGGLLLDIGKVRLPDALLHKKGQLNDREKQKMNMHVYLGVKILEDGLKESPTQDIPAEVINMVATHHERADGSGYPQGLVNEAIPMYGRIAGIVDSYDAMTSQSMHVNGQPMTPNEAIAELYELRGKNYQKSLIDLFIQAVGLYPTGSLVELNTGEVGAVVAVNGLGRLRPSLVVLLDRGKRALLRYTSMDLSQVSREVSISRGLAFGSYGIDLSELFS